MVNMSGRINVVTYTDIGKKRERNEDKIFVNYSLQLFGLCDGMGGLKYGKEAADLVAHYFSRSDIFEYKDTGNIINTDSINMLKNAISNINQKIGFKNYEWYVRYGCTLCGIWFVNEHQALVFNLGDSRCYIYRNKETVLERITNDHNQAQQLFDSKKSITAEEMNCARHILTRYVGKLHDDEPDIFQVNFQSGDRFLVCTDGLYIEVPEKELQYIMYNNSRKEIFEFGDVFIEKALNHGGRDNISLVILEPMIKE